MSERKHFRRNALFALAAFAAAGAIFLFLPDAPSTETADGNTSPDKTENSSGGQSGPQAIPLPSSSQEPGAEGVSEIAFETPVSLGADPFADSLKGTDIDGRLQADSAGNFIINTATRDFFDYFLNTVGEVPPERALAEIEALARGHLPPAAAEQALALLDTYLGYKREAMELGGEALDPTRQNDPAYQLGVLRGALSDLKRLRSQSFSPEAHDAFFGLEEAYGEYTLASIELQQRTDLSPESRNALLEWHRQQLPEEIRKTEQRLHAESAINQQRQAVMTSASSPEAAGEELRKLGMAPEQADEVTRYLKQQEEFSARYTRYEQELDQLESAGLAEGDLASRREQLLERHFGNEQSRTWARLRSLERSSR